MFPHWEDDVWGTHGLADKTVKSSGERDVMTQPYNTNTGEGEAGGVEVKGYMRSSSKINQQRRWLYMLALVSGKTWARVLWQTTVLRMAVEARLDSVFVWRGGPRKELKEHCRWQDGWRDKWRKRLEGDSWKIERIRESDIPHAKRVLLGKHCVARGVKSQRQAETLKSPSDLAGLPSK